MVLRVSWTVFHKRGLEGLRNEFFQKVFRLNMDGDLTRCWSEIRNVFCFKKCVEKDQRDTDGANKASRIDRIYVPQTFHSKILEIQHSDGISDHKLILLNLNLHKFKSWGNYYWKFNKTTHFNKKLKI